jgi:hypothetical protein
MFPVEGCVFSMANMTFDRSSVLPALMSPSLVFSSLRSQKNCIGINNVTTTHPLFIPELVQARKCAASHFYESKITLSVGVQVKRNIVRNIRILGT